MFSALLLINVGYHSEFPYVPEMLSISVSEFPAGMLETPALCVVGTD